MECFVDLGVEEVDGCFIFVYEMGFIEKGQVFFDEQGWLYNQYVQGFGFLFQVYGISVNCVYGLVVFIEQLKYKYLDVEIELMEGVVFFYVCLMEKVFFLEIWFVFNFVEFCNWDNWKVEEVFLVLNNMFIEFL